MTITVVGIVADDEASWRCQTEHSLEPSTAFINRAVVLADDSNCGLLFIHTHPNSLHPPKFSPIDEETNAKLLPNLAEMLPQGPVGSLVLSRSALYGVAVVRRKIISISSARVSGPLNYSIGLPIADLPSKKDSELFDRQ